MSFLHLDWRLVLLAAAAVLLAVSGIVLWWRRRPRDPEEIERRRRAYVNQVGRIVEGAVMEIREAPPLDRRSARGFLFRRKNGSPRRRATDHASQSSGRIGAPHHASRGGAPDRAPRNIILYSYSISGVTYETAQDITGLEERACLERLVAGLPISVKYDPANPGNSILVADDWSGVH